MGATTGPATILRGLSPWPGCGADAGTQRVGVLAGLPALVAELGGDPREMAAAASLDPAQLAIPDNRISFVAMGRLFEAAVALTGVEHIGLLLGQRADPVKSFGLIGDLMQSAPTLGAAWQDLADHQRRYVEGSVVSLSRAGGDAFLGYAVHQANVPAIAQITDAALMVGINLTSRLAGVLPAEIQISRAAPGDPKIYRRMMGVPVRFDAPRSAVILAADQLVRPVQSAGPAHRARLEKAVRAYWAVSRPGIVIDVGRVLMLRIGWDDHALDAIARHMDLHPRSLERRLREAGTSFRTIRNAVRLEVASQMLRETNLSIAATGDALGYNDTSAFVHWFARATGETPRRWRDKAGTGARLTLARSAGINKARL